MAVKKVKPLSETDKRITRVMKELGYEPKEMQSLKKAAKATPTPDPSKDYEAPEIELPNTTGP